MDGGDIQQRHIIHALGVFGVGADSANDLHFVTGANLKRRKTITQGVLLLGSPWLTLYCSHVQRAHRKGVQRAGRVFFTGDNSGIGSGNLRRGFYRTAMPAQRDTPVIQ